MRLYNKEACETVDAGLFTGDDFLNNKDSLIELEQYVDRWKREIERLKRNNHDTKS